MKDHHSQCHIVGKTIKQRQGEAPLGVVPVLLWSCLHDSAKDRGSDPSAAFLLLLPLIVFAFCIPATFSEPSVGPLDLSSNLGQFEVAGSTASCSFMI